MRRFSMFALTIGILFLSGCRKDLCYDHNHHVPRVRLELRASWETIWERDHGCCWKDNWDSSWGYSYDDLAPESASGIRAMTYLMNGQIYDERNLLAEGGIIDLGEDTYSFLFYNNDTEYIVFDDLYGVAHTRATTRSLTRASYMAMHDNERTISPPDMLYSHFLKDFKGQLSLETFKYEGTLKPLVYTYLIRYEFSKGLKHVLLARGALAGMAESVFLYDGHTGNDAATILYDCTLEDWGAEACVRTFGVPNYPDNSDGSFSDENTSYSLNLEVKLTNGSIKTFEFDISDQIVNQPRGGVIIVSGLEIEDDEVKGGGFDVDVEGWGDIIDIPLDL